MRRSSPASARYISIAVNSNTIAPMSIGVLLVGLAFQPAHNQEWGAGRQPIDTGVKDPLLGGGFGILEGARKARYRWTLGDLTEAEADALYGLALDQGETSPLLVVEDPDATMGLNERLHYGLFDGFEAYERANPSQTRWGLSVTQWV